MTDADPKRKLSYEELSVLADARTTDSMREIRSPTFRPRNKAFVLGVAGGSASGKTTVCHELRKRLNDQRVCLLAQDNFYKSLEGKELSLADRGEYNFDNPNSIDFEKLKACLKELTNTGKTSIPQYDFRTHKTTSEPLDINGADVIIVEGILIFTDPELVKAFDMRVFVQTDDDTRLIRRVRRDLQERSRDLGSVLTQWEKFVKPSFDGFVLPSVRHAHLIIPNGASNTVAMDLLLEHLHLRLHEVQRPSKRRMVSNDSEMENTS